MAHQGKYAVSDLEYSIHVTMSNLLQGCETLAKYKDDAEKAGDSEAAAIFGRIHDSYDGYAAELQGVLKRIMTQN